MIVALLGRNGIIGAIGLLVFTFIYIYSGKIFYWIENQTYGTRNYILDKLDFLHIEINSNYITYGLLFLSFGLGSVTLLIVGLFLHQWMLGSVLALILSFLGWKLPKPVINFLVARRIKAFQLQMVDALTLLSNGIRAGLSLPQACGMIVDEMPAPISEEFNTLLQHNRIGAPLEECFTALAIRIPTEDNEMFVSAVNILRETGGNLAETFDTIVGIIRERVRLQQKIDTFVAQGMFQGATIFAMPWAIGAIYFFMEPKSMIRVFESPLGIMMLIAALVLDITGGYVMLKVVQIKI